MGSVVSRALGVAIWLDAGLRIHARDAATGRVLWRPDEARAELVRTAGDLARTAGDLARTESDFGRVERERDELRARLTDLERELAKKR